VSPRNDSAPPFELTNEQILLVLGSTAKSGTAAQAQASYGAVALEADRVAA